MRLSRAQAAALLALLLVGCMSPSWGAGVLLHPHRRPLGPAPALAHRDVVFASEGITLRGWLFPALGTPRGVTVVYLHGSGSNRESGDWIAEKLVAEGFDVLAYDSRAHGASGGDACTYGYHERHDLARALDAVGARRAILLGVSLGAAVALQAAPDDDRVIGVVAVASYADLESAARDRAPLLASEGQIREVFALAEREGRFRVSEVSPERAAARIRVPVLLVHGAADGATPPVHSQRIAAALPGPHRLFLVPGAGHHDALVKGWPEIEAWIAQTAGAGERTGR